MSTDTDLASGNYDWTTTYQQDTEATVTDPHELDNLDVQLVPNEEPPHPKALKWIEDAYAAEGQHGELAIADDAQYDRVRGYLRQAAHYLSYTVTVKPIKDKKDKTIGLTFTVGQRRGRKT
jgi:hypothetical protein